MLRTTPQERRAAQHPGNTRLQMRVKKKARMKRALELTANQTEP
jgi:hypothetical protein